MAPTRDQLLELAERALTGVRDEQAQATAWWERQLSAGAGRAVTSEALSVEIAVVRDGRVGTAVTTAVDDLPRAARARGAAGGHRTADRERAARSRPGPRARRLRRDRRAARAARGPARLGQLAGGGGEDGDRVDARRARVRGAQPGRAARPAPGRAGPLARAHGDGRRARRAGRRRARRGGGGAARRRRPVDAEPGEYAVVLGPWAMAEVARRAGLAFGGPRLTARRAGRESRAPRRRSTCRTRRASRRRCRAPTTPRARRASRCR